LTYSNKSLCNF